MNETKSAVVPMIAVATVDFKKINKMSEDEERMWRLARECLAKLEVNGIKDFAGTQKVIQKMKHLIRNVQPPKGGYTVTDGK